MMDLSQDESNHHLADEIALLKSMYPENLTYDAKASHVKFKPLGVGFLELRLPPSYPASTLPEVIEATGPDKNDLRIETQELIAQQQLGEPCLDAIITDYIALIQSIRDGLASTNSSEAISSSSNDGKRTVIIWLHHLLATGKRKQALSPDCAEATSIRGITKPGYPGVLIFTGSAASVDTHVQSLKHLRWQAFQVRYEASDEWSFKHGEGIIEVETMSDMVAELQDSPGQRELFMEAMKIK